MICPRLHTGRVTTQPRVPWTPAPHSPEMLPRGLLLRVGRGFLWSHDGHWGLDRCSGVTLLGHQLPGQTLRLQPLALPATAQLRGVCG